MTKWYAIVNFWNENDNIQQVLLALKGHFTKIYALDGAYSYFPYNHSSVYNQPYSTDGSLETIKALLPEMPELELFETLRPYTRLIDKLNAGINLCPANKGDYIFHFDGHEVIHGDLALQQQMIKQEKWNVGKIAIVNPALHRFDGFPIPEKLLKYRTQWRIFRWHNNLHLKTYHWNFNVLKWGYLDDVIPDTYGVCTVVYMDHMPKNPERDRINRLYKKDAGKFHYDEIEYVKWREEQGFADGCIVHLPK